MSNYKKLAGKAFFIIFCFIAFAAKAQLDTSKLRPGHVDHSFQPTYNCGADQVFMKSLGLDGKGKPYSPPAKVPGKAPGFVPPPPTPVGTGGPRAASCNPPTTPMCWPTSPRSAPRFPVMS